MQLRTFDELTDAHHTSRALGQMAALGGAFDRRRVETWRRLPNAISDYAGVFAVEGDEVLGQTFVFRAPYDFPSGRETISAIAGVASRREYARKGIARAVLGEIHQRERAAGIVHAALWTNGSWGAHRLYEELGYRDIYTPPWAVRTLPARRGEDAKVHIRAGRRSDLPALDALRTAFGRGRWGFARRIEGFGQVLAATRELDPRTEVLVATSAGRIQGYAFFDRDRTRLVCGEVVAGSARVREALTSAIERKARGLPVAFRDGAVDVMAPWLAARGYVTAAAGWFGLMGATYGRVLSGPKTIRAFGAHSPRFLCFSGDRF